MFVTLVAMNLESYSTTLESIDSNYVDLEPVDVYKTESDTFYVWNFYQAKAIYVAIDQRNLYKEQVYILTNLKNTCESKVDNLKRQISIKDSMMDELMNINSKSEKQLELSLSRIDDLETENKNLKIFRNVLIGATGVLGVISIVK